MSTPTPPPAYPDAPPPTGWRVAAPAVKRRNGWATASFVFGFLAVFPLGIIFGIVGLVRAGKVGIGRGLSWAGMILSVAWMVGAAAVAVPEFQKASNPGCATAANIVTDSHDKIISAANGDDDATLKSELKRTIDGLGDAADQSTNPDATAAITRLKADYQEMLDAVNNDTRLAGDLSTRSKADGDAVDSACGRFIP